MAHDAKGRIAVDATMRSTSHPQVWALGDCASIPGPDGKPYPALAQHAVREARQLAHNIAAVIQGKALEPFVFRTLGTMASLGHSRAVAQVMGVRLTGFIAWWFRRTYYLLQMPRWDRRLRIVLDWTVACSFAPTSRASISQSSTIRTISTAAAGCRRRRARSLRTGSREASRDRISASRQRIFIAGATGVVGVHVVPMLIARGHEVTAIGRSPEKRAMLEAMGARAIELDTFDVTATRRALHGMTTVINLATHMPSSAFRMMLPWEWRENDRIRRDGSAVLADASMGAGVRRFMQESFAPIYEDGGDRWIDESWPVRPAPYNRSILDAERSAAQFSDRGGAGIVMRFAGFYGPDAMLEEMIGVVKKGWSPLPGSPSAYWSSVAQVDAASAVVALVEARAGFYNVCDDDPLTRRVFVEAIANAIGEKAPRPLPRILSALGGKSMELLSRSQRMSNARLKAETGWSPRWPSARDGVPAAIRELKSGH